MRYPDLCPLSCKRWNGFVTKDQLDEFIEIAGRLPTFNLWAFKGAVQHWELIAELYEPQHDSASRVERLGAYPSSGYLEDAALLARALYYRSQPPPAFQQAIDSGLVAPEFAVNRRVKALIYAFLATEQVQIRLGHVLTQRPPFLGSPQDVPLLLSQCAALYGDYFYAAALDALMPYAPDDNAVGNYWLPTRAGLCPADAQMKLDAAFEAFLAARPAAERGLFESRGLHALPRYQLREQDVQLPGVRSRDRFLDLLVYSTYLNNWMDWECARERTIQRAMDLPTGDRMSALGWAIGCRRKASTSNPLIEPLIHVGSCGWPCPLSPELRSPFPARGDALAELVDELRDSLSLNKAPQDVLVTVEITRLEHAFVRAGVPGDANWKLADSFIEDLKQLLTRVMDDGPDGIDGYARVNFLDYLRDKSLYLEGAWTPEEFDRELSRVKKGAR